MKQVRRGNKKNSTNRNKTKRFSNISPQLKVFLLVMAGLIGLLGILLFSISMDGNSTYNRLQNVSAELPQIDNQDLAEGDGWIAND